MSISFSIGADKDYKFKELADQLSPHHKWNHEILNVKQTQSKQKNNPIDGKQVKQTHRILKKKKAKTQYKLQITKSDITKAYLKTKMSIEQCNQCCSTSQQTDRASPHRRSVNQHNSSSSLEHIALGFKHRRSLTRLDWRLPIGHVARSVAHRSAWSRRLLLIAQLAPVLPQPQP